MEDRYLYKAKTTPKEKGEFNNVWVAGNLIVSNGKYYIHPVGNVVNVKNEIGRIIVTHEVIPDTICQCTGLEDRNGKLIWENDVVDFLGHRGIVKFECGSFGIAYEKHIDWDEIQANIMPLTGCENTLYACENDNYISLWEIYWNFNDEDDSLSTVEVIGNIFDNPELLESEE